MVDTKGRLTGARRLITQAAYARRRGVSREAVRKAVAQGRISLLHGKIDPKAADKAWSDNTLIRLGARSKAPARVPAMPRKAAGNGSEPGGDSYLAARTRREAVSAELAELDLKVRKGTLVNADQVRDRVFKGARAARDVVLGLPDRLAPRLVGRDEAGIRQILTEETERICAVISTAPTL